MTEISKNKLERLTTVVDMLANDFSEDERRAILGMDFSQLAGLHGESLKSRISKSAGGLGSVAGTRL
jgi:hypothetical protein